MTHLPTEDETPVPGELLLYTSPDGNIRLDLRIHDETLWMTQQMMAELFQTSVQNIIMHVKNIYEETELEREGTCKDFLQVRQEGMRQVRRSITFYNLDMIISVGYRVNSIRGTQFRIWATQSLKEYMIKGVAIDDERLKNPPIPGTTPLTAHFDELLERIRDIRASERACTCASRMFLPWRLTMCRPERKRRSFQLNSEQTVLCHYRTQCCGIDDDAGRRISAQHGVDQLGRRPNPCQRCYGRKGGRNQRFQSFDLPVPGLCRGSGKKRREIFLHEWEDELNELLRLMGRRVLKGKGQRSKKQAQAHVRGQYRLYEERRRLEAEHQLGNPGR